MRYGIPRRRKKIRSLVSVKERVAKKGGKCHACRGRYEVGADVTVVRVKRRTFHRSCTPADAATGGVPSSGPSAPVRPSSPLEAKLAALESLEHALMITARKVGVTKEMDEQFAKYQKLKALGIRAGTEQESRTALTMAVKQLCTTVFNA